jgi:hypothetical protein
MKTVLAAIALIASAFLAGRAMLLQFITIATNDPQISASSQGWADLFNRRNRSSSAFRRSSKGPLASGSKPAFGLCAVAWWGIVRMWPYAFS